MAILPLSAFAATVPLTNSHKGSRCAEGGGEKQLLPPFFYLEQGGKIRVMKRLREIFEESRQWLAQQPRMQPWEEGIVALDELLSQRLHSYDQSYLQRALEKSEAESSQAASPYLLRIWETLAYHWCDALGRIKRKPTPKRAVAVRESISCDEVLDWLEAGRGFVGNGDLGGNPLFDVVLAEAMLRQINTAAQFFNEKYRNVLGQVGSNYAKRKNFAMLTEADAWWTDFYLLLVETTETRKAKLISFQGRSALEPWCRLVVRNLINDLMRKELRHKTETLYEEEAGQIEESLSSQPRSEQDDEEAQKWLAILAEIMQSLQNEEVVLLQFLARGLPQKEIAATLGIAVGNVTRRKAKVFDKLRKTLEKRMAADAMLKGYSKNEVINGFQKIFTTVLNQTGTEASDAE